MMPANQIAGGPSPIELAKRYVWWKTPEETLREIALLQCQIMRFGTAPDFAAACAYWGKDAFRQALISAPPGALDERSWRFWRLQFGLPAEPMPRRVFGSCSR